MRDQHYDAGTRPAIAEEAADWSTDAHRRFQIEVIAPTGDAGQIDMIAPTGDAGIAALRGLLKRLGRADPPWRCIGVRELPPTEVASWAR